ncbi:MAG: ribonuclease E/G [Proteobacteria bacterium]|nr:ribonuclease E/G [Pseudomonadota bacterium]
MSKKLLIDAAHSEEIRVAIIKDKNLEEFDSETIRKKILKGNIYLAKVMRVEPSLQAAFVEYGNGRQGFLPFSEIHPDYYQIPVADREALLKSELYSVPESYDPLSETNDPTDEVHEERIEAHDLGDDLSEFEKNDDVVEEKETSLAETIDSDPFIAEQMIIQELVESEEQEPSALEKPKIRGRRRSKNKDENDDLKSSLPKPYQYKIQEVIKRRQILLVQVIKEERGNKGAAVTTYLSLAGRYCVLMPNAGRRNGGVSKKIDDSLDRTRLRDIIKSLNVPEGMSLIIRTAGQERRKTDIKRDYEYLVSVWNQIREKTLQSIAPALIHEEGNLITRALRDMYDLDIDDILIEGDEAYREAKSLMKMMIPSHSKRVQHYKNPMLPLFHAFNIEQQMDTVMNPVCVLPSGGYIVMNATEALVAIDVNSGKATKERHIDETALKTNLEAADQIARQLRLRDLSGLIVVDFIDMHDTKHIQQVERRFKEALKNDRARLQIGRISQFGLLEMSRQRLRPSLMENHAAQCPHCQGSGYIRSIESCSLQILRAIEGEAVRGGVHELLVQVPSNIDLYLLNNKRNQLVHIESRFNLKITIERDISLVPPLFNIDVIKGHLFEPIKVEKEEETGVDVQEQQETIQSQNQNKQPFKNKKKPFNKKPKQNLENAEDILEDVAEATSTILPENNETETNEKDFTNKKRHNRYNRYRNKKFRNNKDQDESLTTDMNLESPTIEKETTKDIKNKSSKVEKTERSSQKVVELNDVRQEKKQEVQKKSELSISEQPEKKPSKQKKTKSWLRRLLEN